jgi:hypothetical protein
LSGYGRLKEVAAFLAKFSLEDIRGDNGISTDI